VVPHDEDLWRDAEYRPWSVKIEEGACLPPTLTHLRIQTDDSYAVPDQV